MPFPFATVCDLLQDLENDRKRKRQAKGNTRITRDWFAEHRELVHAQDVDPVALLSTLLPERRTDRVYSIKERSLERIVSTACGLGSRKELLRRWETAPRSGLDFAECVEDVLAQSPNDLGQEVSVELVDTTLQQLASTVCFSSPAVRSSRPVQTQIVSKDGHLLASLFRKLSPRDAKWFCRVILKNFGPVVVPETTVYASFHSELPAVMKIHDNFAVAVNLLQEHLQAYRARGLTFTREDVARTIKPQIGVKVGRQAWRKARGIKHCLEMGSGWMSCQAKVDGEYCQVHIDLSKRQSRIQIFSKSGKDSTMDRLKLHPAIRSSLRLDTEDCKFKTRCILEGEMVVYNDLEKRIAGFEKIRKHVSRSGRFIGTLEDSQPHAFERLMIVYYDVLLIDDDSMLDQGLLERQRRLSSLVHCQEGQAALVGSHLINFNARTAADELRKAFASCIVKGDEGLVLKADDPYFNFGVPRRRYESSCLKLKKGYINGLGDVGDFAVVGARYDPTAAKTLGLSEIKFTHFYLGCIMNKEESMRFQAQPVFRVVNEVEISSLNLAEHFFRNVFVMDVLPSENDKFIVEQPQGIMQGKKMTAIFLEPAVFDITCFDFHQASDTNFWSLRFPYVSKIHTDRDWKDCVSFEELQNLATARENYAEQEDSQELREWIMKLEDSESKRQRQAESQITDITKATTSQGSSMHSPSQVTTALAQQLHPLGVLIATDPSASAVSPSARPSPVPGSNSLSPRKRQRVRSPVSTRRTRQRKDDIDLTLSPTSQGSQGSSRQPLGDITSNPSSQVNSMPASPSQLSRSETFHAEPKMTKSSPTPGRLPNAASFQTTLAFSSPCKAASKTSRALSTSTRSGPPSTPAPAPTCQHAGTACALADYLILLSPCVANMPLLSETLLPGHGVRVVFKDIPSWLASQDLHSGSSAKPPRLVLVEAKRTDETQEFLRRLHAEPLRSRTGGMERVIAYDWRLIEAITDLERRQKRSDGSGTRQKIGTGALAKELWRRHYAGIC